VRGRQRLASVAICVVCLAGALFGGFLWGSNNPAVTIFTSDAYVGIDQASVVANGWAYNIPADICWVGTDGTWRQGGFPACLSPVGSRVPVRFGAVPIAGPNGVSWRQVVWVSCIV
jgi:hypothetical protein